MFVEHMGVRKQSMELQKIKKRKSRPISKKRKTVAPVTSPDSKVAIGYAVQNIRTQITRDWKDACAYQFEEENQKLGRFIQNEKVRI